MAIVYLVLSAVAFVAIWYLLPFAARKVSSRKLHRYCRDEGAIVLSYDDGPSERLLPRLLALLGEERVQATFFLLGRNVAAHPGMARQLAEGGHEVGSHTFDHSNAWKTWPWVAARDLSKGVKSLRDVDIETRLFRPPYGKATLATLAGCRLRGVRLGWWTIDSQDVWDRRLITDVVSDLKANGGGVVLMHDLDRDELISNGVPHSDYVLDLTREIVKFAKESGLKIKRLDEIYGNASK